MTSVRPSNQTQTQHVTNATNVCRVTLPLITDPNAWLDRSNSSIDFSQLGLLFSFIYTIFPYQSTNHSINQSITVNQSNHLHFFFLTRFLSLKVYLGFFLSFFRLMLTKIPFLILSSIFSYFVYPFFLRFP